MDCPHQDCFNDCFDTVALTKDSGAGKISFDYDDADLHLIDNALRQPVTSVSTGPPDYLLLLAATTPIQRYDILLK